jgi:aminoglycoside phosphotransferase (APT) family kinase protein
MIVAAVPTSIEDLTPDWLTYALSESFPGVAVTDVLLTDVLHGSAAKARLRVQSTGSPDAPTSLLVKASFTEAAGEDALSQQWAPLMMMLNAAEVRFYREDADAMGDRSPRCWYAAEDESGSVLVLEDLNDRDGAVTFGSFDRPLGGDAMASVLDVLAMLHSARWDDQRLAREPLTDGFLEGGMLDGFLSQVNWEQQMARPRGKVVPAELRDHSLVARAVRTAWAAKRLAPVSLIHGDPHIGNLYFDKQGAGLLDWQLQTSGHWASDVVYAISTAMEIEDRRSYECDLLQHYLGRLRGHGVDAPTFDDAWLWYRKLAIWGFVSFLTPGDGIQSEEYNAVVGERNAVAAVDLESISALEVDR